MKECNYCHKVKPLNEFYKHPLVRAFTLQVRGLKFES